MKRALPCSLPFFLVACTAAPPAESPNNAQAPSNAAAVPPPAASAAPAPGPAAPAEEPAMSEERQKLEADRARMRQAHEAELARLTPEIRAEAKALADESYEDGSAAITAALAGKHRQPGHAERDPYRHAVETMEFFGLRPDMTVLEYGPGAGWYTELLAPALAKQGKLLVTSGDPSGPPEERSTYYAERTKLFLDRLPEAYGKVETVIVDATSPDLPLDGTVDLALVIRGMHGMVNRGSLEEWLSEIHQALEPKGVFGVVQHRAKPGTDPQQTAKDGYLPEAWVIEQVEAAGFELLEKSEINANPEDTTDHPEGVWTLPPTLRLGDEDRDKYEAIGESDRMTLKFAKVE